MSRSDPSIDAKKQARREIRSRVEAMSLDQKAHASRDACDRIPTLHQYDASHAVLLYMPMPTELDVTPLIERSLADGKVVAVPRTVWDERRMEAVEIRTIEDGATMVTHGVREPRDGRVVDPSELDLVVVPAMGFDESCNRLGRGGGFYDRFLADPQLRAVTVGIAFEAQIIHAIPTLRHDVRVDMVVTERRVIGGNAPEPSNG
jgi:5-formyltetrahydrofolate cyclo-ligase